MRDKRNSEILCLSLRFEGHKDTEIKKSKKGRC